MSIALRQRGRVFMVYICVPRQSENCAVFSCIAIILNSRFHLRWAIRFESNFAVFYFVFSRRFS